MKRLFYYLINTACIAFYKKSYETFMEDFSLEKIKDVQQEKLLTLLEQQAETEYGKKYDFKGIKGIKEYGEKVPLSDYETYRPYIERLEQKKAPLLTHEVLIAFEPTSGSTKASKLIPYTKMLKEEFQWGIKPWLYDLYTAYPAIRWGKSYWSITPATSRQNMTPSGIPIGFEEDGDYFGKLEKYLMDCIFVSPKGIKAEIDMDKFYEKTVLALLKEKNLTLISVWNPTYLLLLLEYLDTHQESLLPKVPKRRRRQIEKAVRDKHYEAIWQKLVVISCWCDANAKVYAEQIQALFPNTFIQPKGLLSTECFTSFPLVGKEGCVMSMYSHFFEFLPLNKEEKSENETVGIEALEKNKTYEVVVTTAGGFYRYRTYDVIEVVGFKEAMPLVRFIGKNDKVCDLFGEKLHEDFCKVCIETLQLNETFYLFAPQKDHYVLYIQSEELPSVEQVEKRLRQNFHYDYCRHLGQLKPIKLFILTGNPKKEYSEGCMSKGQKLGDIKPTYLALTEGWDTIFTGYYEE